MALLRTQNEVIKLSLDTNYTAQIHAVLKRKSSDVKRDTQMIPSFDLDLVEKVEYTAAKIVEHGSTACLLHFKKQENYEMGI